MTTETQGCAVCGWDAGETHDDLIHLIDAADREYDSSEVIIMRLCSVAKVYRKGLANLSAICADREMDSRKKLERIDVRLTQLQREARDAAAGKGKQ